MMTLSRPITAIMIISSTMLATTVAIGLGVIATAIITATNLGAIAAIFTTVITAILATVIVTAIAASRVSFVKQRPTRPTLVG